MKTLKIVERLKQAGNKPVGFLSSEKGDVFFFGDQARIEEALEARIGDCEINQAGALLASLDFGCYEEEPEIVEL